MFGANFDIMKSMPNLSESSRYVFCRSIVGANFDVETSTGTHAFIRPSQ